MVLNNHIPIHGLVGRNKAEGANRLIDCSQSTHFKYTSRVLTYTTQIYIVYQIDPH